ncbi:amino acid permease [Spongorhabdus nitratireducens]
MAETSEASLVEQQSAANEKWTARDTGWMFNLFGTAVGAGILYLPLGAASGGIWPLILLSLITGPMIWLAHRNLTRFCLSGTHSGGNITHTVIEHFGRGSGRWLTFAYFLAIYPIMLMYGIGLTNVVQSFVEYQLGWEPPGRVGLSLVLVVALMLVTHAKEQWMLRAVELLVFPLVVFLVLLSLYLIPEWSTAVFQRSISTKDFVIALFLTTPLLVFSFNHSPVCSSLAEAYRHMPGGIAASRRKTSQIIWRNTCLLLVVILLFVFSCILTLTPAEVELAREKNLPVLSVLANREGHLFFSVIAPVLSFMAIASSFVGVYLGTLEGVQGLITQQVNKRKLALGHAATCRLSILFVFLSTWLAACMNWSVIAMIEVVVVPVLGAILFFMPVYAHYRVPKLKECRQPLLDIFIVVMGGIAVSGFLFSWWSGG